MCRIYGGTLQWDPQRRRDVKASGNFRIQCAYPKVDVGRSSSLKNAFSIGIYSGRRHIPRDWRRGVCGFTASIGVLGFIRR
jgi:hypothetical protein